MLSCLSEVMSDHGLGFNFGGPSLIILQVSEWIKLEPVEYLPFMFSFSDSLLYVYSIGFKHVLLLLKTAVSAHTHTHTHTHTHARARTRTHARTDRHITQMHSKYACMQASSHTHILSLAFNFFSYRKYAALQNIFQSFSIAAHRVFIKCVSVGNQMCWCECMCLSVSSLCCASRAQSFSFQLSSAYWKLKNNHLHSQTSLISVLEL